ncbi:hypothetical protein cypCar_00015476 [Cyprinus carpio]|nr:hypothetical protein cypCar_00015476 [Cyprinus carpio]
MCSLKAIQDWCGDVCEGYSDVLITDMSSSFTDGLAFCAIIHKHRPDLLDFHSLSKHNIYDNMRLAFDVAERELGIPALLDPDELVSVEEPDLLSILTYVSQLYCVFRGNSHVSQKIPVNNESSSTKTQEQTHTLFSSDVVRSSDKSVCSVCHTRVHLIQRVLVKGQLYHRSCFRKRAEPQEPPCPTPRSPDHRPDNVLSQSALRKEHPWMKLVDPGPWSHLPSAPSSHSRHRHVTFNPFLEDESKDEEVITDTRVSEKQVCEEQKKLEERLLELERRGVQLETEMRRCTNESLLVDWFLLIHMKNMLVRRDTELVYMVKQQRLEDQQADVEFEIRRLFNKPEQDWSSDDRHQEHQLMSSLLSIIQQRNDIISSLDEDRQREKEEDTTLNAVIQRMEFLTQTDKQRDKCSRSFKRLQMFKKSSCKTENTGRRKKKNS